MYEQEIDLIEGILNGHEGSQIWSVYSLCNHNKVFESIIKCKNILFEMRNKKEYELVYLIFSKNGSNELINKLKYENELLNDNVELNTDNIYGIVKKSGLSNVNNKNMNKDQFYTECEDIYRNINTFDLLSEKLWYSRYSQISNKKSTKTRTNEKILVDVNVGRVSGVTNIDRSDPNIDENFDINLCKTEPYPMVINNNNDINEKNDNNTDPYPVKLLRLKNDVEINDSLDDKIIGKSASKTEKKEDKDKVEINLFENEDDIINNELKSNNEMDLIAQKKNSRKRTKIDTESSQNCKTNENKHVNNCNDDCIEDSYDPSQVQPIVHRKIRKEKIYEDTKTGYLIVEDDVDFVMEKAKPEKSLDIKTNSNNPATLKQTKHKKTNIDSKQQTLNSFFKIVSKNTTQN
ncbi:hypothetical protein FG379_001576 [Cryptosporidium bovis]|uniref:uncharacterized protein n=1 Tax=Cryptosporidium bovis TaxID=310047 RepID=UPI00351A5194|nr:hypothetical protein FG379_001576 [Cryptosporidium bovis]